MAVHILSKYQNENKLQVSSFIFHRINQLYQMLLKRYRMKNKCDVDQLSQSY